MTLRVGFIYSVYLNAKWLKVSTRNLIMRLWFEKYTQAGKDSNDTRKLF